MMPTSPSVDFATILALRTDLALQIARYVEKGGDSQTGAALALGIPQPTLSKIVRGQVDNLSLEMLLRIATRAQLELVLVTGKEPAEAGVFVTRTAAASRAQRSGLADRAREEVSVRAQRLSPEQRLDAQLRHSELLAELRSGAQVSQSERPEKRIGPQRAAKARSR